MRTDCIYLQVCFFLRSNIVGQKIKLRQSLQFKLNVIFNTLMANEVFYSTWGMKGVIYF